MSFRVLRDFTEAMRELGYPRIVSVENFRTPNFALVADALYWMVYRYEPHARISDEITTPKERVNFIGRVVQLMAGRAQLKLNAKRLYAADGRSVKELLKVANLLLKAKRENAALEESRNSKLNGGEKYSKSASGNKASSVEGLEDIVLPPLHNMRALAAEITESGAKLYDLLQHEAVLRERREDAIRFLDATNSGRKTSENDFLRQKIHDLVTSQEENIAMLEKQCKNLEKDERSLTKKIKKKKAELERSEKRLKSLQKVRPAFMDELERLEIDLKKNYELYMERYRNLEYLETQLDAYNKTERSKLESAKRNLNRMQRRLRKQGESLDRGTKAMEMAFNRHHSRQAADNGKNQQQRVPKRTNDTRATESGSETSDISSDESDESDDSVPWNDVALSDSEDDADGDSTSVDESSSSLPADASRESDSDGSF